MSKGWYSKNKARHYANQLAYNAANPDKRKVYATKYREAKRLRVYEFKNVPCIRCGGRFHPVCMDFHHRDPSTKLFEISRSMCTSFAKLTAEMEKCDVLCANCHRIAEHAPEEY